MFWTLTRDAGGNIVCGSRYSEDPGPLHDGETLCGQEEFEAWRAAFLAPPPVPLTVSSLDFLNLFTAAEQAAVYSAAPQSPALFGFLMQLLAAGSVQLDDPRVVAGVSLLHSAGLVAADRPAQVLGNVAPPAVADAVTFDLAHAAEETPAADAVAFDPTHATET